MTTTARPTTTLHLRDLAARIAGAVPTPDSPGYPALATPWNVAAASDLLAVVEVADANDVVEVVRYAADNGIDVGVQATGHGATVFTRPTVLIQTVCVVDVPPSSSGKVAANAVPRRSGSVRRAAGVDDFVQRRGRGERRPFRLGDQRPESVVVRLTPVLSCLPRHVVDEPESGGVGDGAVQLMTQVTGFGDHVRVDLLPESDELVLLAGGYFEVVQELEQEVLRWAAASLVKAMLAEAPT